MSDDEEWLNIGKSFQVPIQQEVKTQQQNLNESFEKKQNVKKEKKKQKLIKSQQIAIKFTEEQIDVFHDQKLENQNKVDESKKFIYKHEMGKDLLSIQILPIGDYQILGYGHLESSIPHYIRTKENLIIGIKNKKKSLKIFEDVGAFAEKRSIEYPRYIEAADQIFNKSFIIRPQKQLEGENFIAFNNLLQEREAISNEQQLQERNLELQQSLQQNVNNLEIWKEFLNIQDKLAEVQGYNEPLLLANRKLSILEKLESASEILADHPWVLAFKISLMQNLELRNDELHKKIDDCWKELFQKYVHIQPIWILFLDNKLKTEIFSSTMLRLEAQNHIANLQNLINQTSRVQLIQLFKKIYIELIQLIAFYENEMGFRERSTGILQALCEMNLFAPKHLYRTYDLDEKVKEFKKFWDSNLRTGEQNEYGWIEQPQYKDDFIGFCDQNLEINDEEDQIKQFLNFQSLDRWRPANYIHDKQWIEQNVDAVVIYEDIEPYLYIFNDTESKLSLASTLIQQIGFPSIDFNILPQINSFHCADMCYKKVNLNLFQNDYLIRFSSIFQYELQKNLSRFIYIKRFLEKVYEQINNQFLLLYIFIMNSVLYLQNDIQAPNTIIQNELKSGLKKMKQILKEQQNNLIFWLIFSEIESIKQQQPQTQLIQKIKLYAKSKKQNLMVFYFQFINQQSQSYDNSINIIKNVLKLYEDESNFSDCTLVLKIRNLFKQQQNKWQNLEYLNQNKKELKIFQLSKRAVIFIFWMFLEQHLIKENLSQIQQESKQINMIHFQDSQQQKKMLSKYKNETSLILLNLLRFSPEKEEICKVALLIDQNQLIFFNYYISLLSKKFLYFQKIWDLKKIIEFQSPQICWISNILSQDPNKEWFLLEFLKSQSEKGLAEIYCENKDQENFEGAINLKYNYILDMMYLDLQKKLNPNVKEMYKSLKRHPYSILMYTKVIEEIKERNEALHLLQDLQEKDLKCF